MNDDTQGIHEEEFIVLYGRPKSMKTWVALVIAAWAYYYASRRVLIFSLEMKPKVLLRRIAAILAKVDYEAFKNGKLNAVDAQKMWDVLSWLEWVEAGAGAGDWHAPALRVTAPGDENGGGIGSLSAKIREFKPDLVIVDGMYLMRDDRQKVRTVDWKAIAHISQDLKRLAATMSIPIIGVTQANRGAAKNEEAELSELAYADALAQDCDLAIRVKKSIDQTTRLPEILLQFPGTREGKLDGFVIHGVPATCFEYKRPYAYGNDPANQPDPNSPKGKGKSNGPSAVSQVYNTGVSFNYRSTT